MPKRTILWILVLALLAGLVGVTIAILLAPTPPPLLPPPPEAPPPIDSVFRTPEPEGLEHAEPSHRGILRVVVLTERSRRGVNGAVVSFFEDIRPEQELDQPLPDPQKVFTSREGVAELEVESPALHGILVSLPGRFGRELRKVRSNADSVNLVEVLVEEGGVIEGRVTDANGKAIAGAHLATYPSNLLGGLAAIQRKSPDVLRQLLRLASLPSSRGIVDDSDAEGRFALVGIPASQPRAALGPPATGNRVLVALHPGYEPVILPVAVATDAPIPQDVQFGELGWHIEGTVADSDGAPIPRAFVDFLIHQGDGTRLPYSRVADETGQFQVPAVLGKSTVIAVDLTVFHPIHGTVTTTLTRPPGSPLVLKLSTAHTVAVQLYVQAGELVEGASLRALIQCDGHQVGEHQFQGLPATIYLPRADPRITVTGSMMPPAGYRCLQTGLDNLRAAYEIDAVLAEESPGFAFEPGTLDEYLDRELPK